MAKKKPQRKRRPSVLNSPISYDLELLMAGASPDPKSTDKKAAVGAFFEQWVERLLAVYEYFEIDPIEPNAKDALIRAMCFKLFPQGFSCRGGKKRKSGQGNSRQWTVKRRQALVRIVEDLESAGIEKQAIFDAYGKIQKPRMAGVSVKARYSEAIKALDTDFKLLDLADQLEILKMYEDFLARNKSARLGATATEIK